jgi:hypothetical protein
MFPEIREVGKHKIDPEMLVARERETRVDDHELVSELVDHQVLTDLPETAERGNPQSGHGRKYHLPAA